MHGTITEHSDKDHHWKSTNINDKDRQGSDKDYKTHKITPLLAEQYLINQISKQSDKYIYRDDYTDIISKTENQSENFKIVNMHIKTKNKIQTQCDIISSSTGKLGTRNITLQYKQKAKHMQKRGS